MHNEPRQQLCQLIAQYGRSLSEDFRRCGVLLKDHCGQYKREIFILVNALENRVATELLNASAGVPEVVLLSRLSKQFFNATAQRHAENNHVELYDQLRLAQCLKDYPVQLLDIERFLYTDWRQA